MLGFLLALVVLLVVSLQQAEQGQYGLMVVAALVWGLVLVALWLLLWVGGPCHMGEFGVAIGAKGCHRNGVNAAGRVLGRTCGGIMPCGSSARTQALCVATKYSRAYRTNSFGSRMPSFWLSRMR